MRSLTLLLVVCAASAAQCAQAADQPSLAAIRTASAADAQKHCAGVPPGGGRIVACLKEHKDSLSDQCKQAAGLSVNPGSRSAPGAGSALPSAGANAPGAMTGAPMTTAPSSKTVQSAAGEKFTERVIADTEHGGMRAATIHVPEKWHFESKIEWHYNWVEYPLSFSSHSENPDNAEAYFQYPLLRLESTEVAPQFRQYDKGNKLKPGKRLPTGALYSPPQPPMQAE